MARGRGRGHKGRSRHFNSPEEIAEQNRRWREKKDNEEDDDDDDEEGEASGEGSSEEESSDDDRGAKGVEALIEIENPNRIAKKPPKFDAVTAGAGPSSKPSSQGAAKGGPRAAGPSKTVDGQDGDSAEPAPQLSRREREQIEKQKAQEKYQILHAQGKTEQARADLARLAIIKAERAAAAKKREEEQKAKAASGRK